MESNITFIFSKMISYNQVQILDLCRTSVAPSTSAYFTTYATTIVFEIRFSYLHLKLSKKLDEKIFLVWRQQIKLVVNAHNLQGFLLRCDILDWYITNLIPTLQLRIPPYAPRLNKINGFFLRFNLLSSSQLRAQSHRLMIISKSSLVPMGTRTAS